MLSADLELADDLWFPDPPRYAEAIENTLLQQEYEKEVPSVNSRESSCSSSEWRVIFAVAISFFANSGISNSSTVYFLQLAP
jgi:hypothetical protein